MSGETIESLRSCRDHWKVAFEHERENVIRLRGIVAFEHAAKREVGECRCEDCKLVREHATRESSPPTNNPERVLHSLGLSIRNLD